MSNVLILYASSHGTTERIASTIAASLRRRGHHVDVYDAAARGRPSLNGFDAVVIGSRVHGGRHARSIRRFVAEHLADIRDRRSAFFSVSMAAVGGGDDVALRRFLQDTRWRPHVAVSLAGALPYRRYNPILRLVMKHMSRKAGQITDTSRDHDFVDWRAVNDFVDAIDARLLPSAPAYPPPVDPPLAPSATILS